MAYQNFEQKAVIDTPKYSKFDMTYESIGTLQMGVGTPVFHKPVVPGDNTKLSIDQIMRLAPLSQPVFDDVSLHFRAFFVPNRVLDPRWKEFITGGVGLYGASDEEIEPLSFTVRSLLSAPDEVRVNYEGNTASLNYCSGLGGLADWLNFHFAHYDPATGQPATVTLDDTGGFIESYESIIPMNIGNFEAASQQTFDILPFLGYQKIFDDWYRNERFQSERLPDIMSVFEESSDRVFDTQLSSSNYSINPFRMWRVNYGKDRYTTALPEPVVGGDVNYIESNIPVVTVGGSELSSSVYTQLGSSPTDPKQVGLAGKVGAQSSYDNGLYASLASAAEATIRQLKVYFKLYSFFMKDTYNGNRYVEFMDSHFDVRVPDSTLDRAIYLGDHKVRISFGEVFQTSGGDGSDGSGVLGDYAGRGAAYSADGYLVNEKFLEHGQLYVIASILPRAKYFQGVDRKFWKSDRFSYFFPEFQNIGDDMLYSEELYFAGDVSSETTFGYAPRWSELKECVDEVHGDFLCDSMDEYHFGRVFLDAPVLGEKFSQVPTINRPFAYTESFAENYLINMRWTYLNARPLMMYETF